MLTLQLNNKPQYEPQATDTEVSESSQQLYRREPSTKEFHTSSAAVTSNMEGGDAFEMGGMDVMEVGDMEMMEGGDMEMMEGGDMVVMEAEECGGDGHRLRFKGARPRQNNQVPQKRRPRVKVKDYMCFSIISIMCCNVMFLGLLALRMSMRVSYSCSYQGMQTFC